MALQVATLRVNLFHWNWSGVAQRRLIGMEPMKHSNLVGHRRLKQAITGFDGLVRACAGRGAIDLLTVPKCLHVPVLHRGQHSTRPDRRQRDKGGAKGPRGEKSGMQVRTGAVPEA